ncbi:putative pentatricopeptide repeat-containing protein At5g08310, mitochondrial [Impatiens glandulifera]|uniref:putative pentatricopeptide repeat-containing protein At5g08310, mitochondrial n=1 Tax=Impatiens glandulifera TaxID=253017 RepID=UPI001FB0C3F9|nr:putative pentatricopeptide repeat-containing protein At5g08310, mitochondrial [Impatiens glandulifera]
MHLLFKSMEATCQWRLFEIYSRPNQPSSLFMKRFLCMATNNSNTYNPGLAQNHRQLIDGLLHSLNNRPFRSDSSELRDFTPFLTTRIVETVLKGLNNWRTAHMFFTWASDQSGYRHNCYAYNAMASILARAREDSALRLLAAEVVTSRCSLTPGALGFLIRCLGSEGLVKEANALFDQVREVGLCVPNVYSYNCLLETFSSSSSVDFLETRYREMCNLGYKPDKYTLTPVLRCYCNAGKFDKALQVLDIIKQQGWLDSHVLSILVVNFSKCAEFDKVVDFIEKMDGSGITLNGKTFYVLIHGFVKESKLDNALEVFDKMKKLGFTPDFSIYDVLIGGLCKNKETEKKALHLFTEMIELGINPNAKLLQKLISSLPGENEILHFFYELRGSLSSELVRISLYNAVLDGLVNIGSIEKAYSLLMTIMGEEKPDSTSFAIVINGLCCACKLDVALDLLRKMGPFNCKPDLLLYNNLIDSLCNSNRIDECYNLLSEMKEFGLQPSQFTYNSIFGYFCKAEDVESAYNILKEMRLNRHEPWIKHYSLLVKKLCERGKAVEACSFLDGMVREGLLPDIIAYSSAIDGLFKIKELDRALFLFADLIARGYCPDVVAHNIVINGLCKDKRVSEAQDVLSDMVGRGLVPSIITYNQLIDGWCKTGDIEKAMACITRMVRDECEPNVVTYTTMIDGLCNAGRPENALDFWNEMLMKRYFPNRISYMVLIHSLCKCSRPDTALVYLYEMEEKGMRPDSFVYVAIIDAFVSSKNSLLALDMLERMSERQMFPETVDKNHSVLRAAIIELSGDVKVLSKIKILFAEGRIPITLNYSNADTEDAE